MIVDRHGRAHYPAGTPDSRGGEYAPTGTAAWAQTLSDQMAPGDVTPGQSTLRRRRAKTIGELLDTYDGTRGEDRDAELDDRDTWTPEQWDEFNADHYDDEGDRIWDWTPPWSAYHQAVQARARQLHADVAAAVEGVYGDGFEAKLLFAEELPDGDIRWEVQFLTPSGELAGEAERIFGRRDDQIYVYNHHIDVFESYRRRGLATDFTRAMDEFYRTSGAAYEYLVAGSTHGGLVWALQGYDFLDGYGDVPERMRDWLAANPDHSAADALREMMRRMSNGEHVSAAEIATLGYSDGAEQWPGERIMKGSEWHGIKWL